MNQRRRREQPGEARPLADEAAERGIIGCCLQQPALFWQFNGRLRPEHFSIARLSRIWDTMQRCSEAGKPIGQNWISLLIKGDAGEDTPIRVFLAVLMNDAPPTSEADIYADTVLHLANKRATLEELDRARAEVLAVDVGKPAEEMKDIVIRRVSAAFSGDRDDDMMDYGDWGARVHKAAQKALDAGEDGAIGLSPGLKAVEEVVGRLLPGKLTVLIGLPGSGKSALARQMMEAAAIDGAKRKLGKGLVNSLEMMGEEYAARRIAEDLNIAADRIEQGSLNQAEVEAVGRAVMRMREIPLVVDAKPRQTMEQLRARALKVKNTSGLSCLAIDHLLLVRQMGRVDGLMDRVSETTIEAKGIAKELGVPVLMLAQINEKKFLESSASKNPFAMPNSSHIFGGETIVMNADVIMFVHRPALILAKREPSQTAKAKNEGEATPYQRWQDAMDEYRDKAFVYNNKRRGGASYVKREMIFKPAIMTFRDI